MKENAYSSEKPLGEVAVNTEERKMGIIFIYIYCYPPGATFSCLRDSKAWRNVDDGDMTARNIDVTVDRTIDMDRDNMDKGRDIWVCG